MAEVDSNLVRAEMRQEDLVVKQTLMSSSSNYSKFNYNCLQQQYCEDNCLEVIKFNSGLKISDVRKYRFSCR